MKNFYKRLLLTIFALTVAGCVTPDNPDQIIRGIATSQIEDQTNAAYLGNSRYRIDSSASFFQDLRVLEYNALARAAQEAREANAPYFVIAYVDYDNGGISSLNPFSFDVGLPASGWIGTYEELLTQRQLSTLGESLPSGMGFQKVTMVVRLLTEDDRGGRPAFSSLETYESLIQERIDRRRINAPKKLPVRSWWRSVRKWNNYGREPQLDEEESSAPKAEVDE